MTGYICFILLVIITAAAFYWGWQLGCHPRVAFIAFVAVVLLLLILGLRFRLDIAFHLFPVSYFIFFEATLFVPFAVFFFALASRNVTSRITMRALLLCNVLLCLYVVIYSSWIFLPTIHCEQQLPRNGVYLQSTSSSCGPAALATLLLIHKIPATEQEMATLCYATQLWGTSLLRIAGALQHKVQNLLCSVDFIKCDWQHLSKLSQPCIVDTRFSKYVNHVVVLMHMDSKQVVLGDPLQGRVIWSKEKFLHKWTGYAIILSEPQEVF